MRSPGCSNIKVPGVNGPSSVQAAMERVPKRFADVVLHGITGANASKLHGSKGCIFRRRAKLFGMSDLPVAPCGAAGGRVGACCLALRVHGVPLGGGLFI